VRHGAVNLNQFLADRGQHPASSVRDHHHVLDSNAALSRLALARSLAWPASLAALAWSVARAALAWPASLAVLACAAWLERFYADGGIVVEIDLN